MFLWFFWSLLGFQSTGWGANFNIVHAFKCSAIAEGIELSDEASNAYIELFDFQSRFTVAPNHSLSDPSAQEVLKAQKEALLAFLSQIKETPALYRSQESEVDDPDSELFIRATFVRVRTKIISFLKAPFVLGPSWTEIIGRQRLGRLFIQTLTQSSDEFFRAGDLDIERLNQKTSLLEFDEAAELVANELFLARLKGKEPLGLEFRLGAIIATNREQSIFEKNQLLPLPILLFDFSGNPLRSYEGLERGLQEWKQVMGFYEATHSDGDRQRSRWLTDSIGIQKLYQRTRAAALNERKRATIDWVFHSIRFRPDANYAQGLKGIVQLIARIGDETPEQIVFTNALLPRLQAKEALGPGTVLEEILDARDALLISFSAALH
jgi:hypothetical protein